MSGRLTVAGRATAVAAGTPGDAGGERQQENGGKRDHRDSVIGTAADDATERPGHRRQNCAPGPGRTKTKAQTKNGF